MHDVKQGLGRRRAASRLRPMSPCVCRRFVRTSTRTCSPKRHRCESGPVPWRSGRADGTVWCVAEQASRP